MKRLLLTFLAALFTLFNGLDWVPPKVDTFTYNTEEFEAYYTPPEEGDSDYTALWREMHPSSGSDVERCDIAPWVVSNRTEWNPIAAGKLDVYIPTTNKEDGTELAWTFDENSNVYSYEHTAESEIYIAAPASGKIMSSHFACDYGRSMEYIFAWAGQQYALSITNAKCWYCCRNKKEPVGGRYTATTSESLQGKDMPAGALLCVGQQGTKIVIGKVSA